MGLCLPLQTLHIPTNKKLEVYGHNTESWWLVLFFQEHFEAVGDLEPTNLEIRKKFWEITDLINPNPVRILARKPSWILQKSISALLETCPLSSKYIMHFRWSFIFSIYGLYFLPGRNFAPFKEGNVPISNSAEFFPKSGHWRILMDLGGGLG